MNIPTNIFKSYDIRGIYPDELNEENIYQIVQGVLKFISEQVKHRPLRIVTGRDMRLSGPSLYPIFQKALLDAGVEVFDVGLVSTPSVYFAVYHGNYDAGIQLSASHNPPKYNGLKMVINNPNGLIKVGQSTGMDKVKEYAIAGVEMKSDKKGTITKIENTLKDEIENAMEVTGFTSCRPMKVVADAANAMGATYIDALFKDLPCELIKMNFELDGSFPAHQPDPLVKANLVDLQKRVLEEGADFGLAPDGDADRMFFIDEKGEVIPASIITALVAKEMLKTHPGETILYDIRYTNTPKRIIEENGGKSGITKVGHAYITEMMNKTGAIFGGESSGHYFFKATGNAESQLPIILTVLSVMTRENRPLSDIAKDLLRSYESGEINFKSKNAPVILDALKERYNDGEISTMDGIAIEYKNWRFGVRSSNTEPLLRLNVEADDRDTMVDKRDELVIFLESQGAERAE